MKQTKDNWKKIDNEICDILRDCGDGHIDGHEEILELFKKELDKAREEEWSATRMLWDRMDKWQKEWKKENPKERKLVFNDALKLIEWKIITAREEERKELLEKIEKIYEKNNLAKN